MAQSVMLRARGLHSFKNQLSEIPEGALEEALNVIIDRDGILNPRRGFSQYSDIFDNPIKQIRQYKDRLILHKDNTLLFEELDGNGNLVGFNEFNGSFSEVEDGLRIKSIELNGNFYFTTNEGIKKISAASTADLEANGTNAGYVTQAGGVKAFNIVGKTVYQVGGAGFLTASSKVAYRMVWGITDANETLILGSPSARIVVENKDDSNNAVVELTFPVPDDITNTNYFYQIYRTEVVPNTREPSEEYTLVNEEFITNDQITAKIVTITDEQSQDLAAQGAYLYTNNLSGEGIEQSNDAPPFAKDIALYKGYTFYGNTTNRHALDLTFLGVTDVNNGDKLYISDGIDTSIYTFRGNKETFTFDFNDINELTISYLTSDILGKSRYFILPSANDDTKYLIWFDDSLDENIQAPTVLGTTSFPIDLNEIASFRVSGSGIGLVTESPSPGVAGVINILSHGFSEGEEIFYYTDGTPIDGLTNKTKYYVRNVTTDTFELSETKDSIPLDLNDDGDNIQYFRSQKIESASVLAQKIIDDLTILTNDFNGANLEGELTIITANNGNIETNLSLEFNPSDINTTTNEITVNKHGLIDGQTITYSTTGDEAKNLGKNNQYTIEKIDDNTVKLYPIGGQINYYNINGFTGQLHLINSGLNIGDTISITLINNGETILNDDVTITGITTDADGLALDVVNISGIDVSTTTIGASGTWTYVSGNSVNLTTQGTGTHKLLQHTLNSYFYQSGFPSSTYDSISNGVGILLNNGDLVKYQAANPAGGLTSGNSYYVTNRTSTTFQLLPAKSTITAVSSDFNVTTSRSIFLSNTNDKLYILRDAPGRIYQYALSPSGNVINKQYEKSSPSILSETSGATEIRMKPDGSKMYVLDELGNLYEYNLSTPGDVSTATYSSISVNIPLTQTPSFFFKPDGLKLYVYDQNNPIYEFDLSPAWDITSISLAGFGVAGYTAESMFFSDSGDKVFISVQGSPLIAIHDLGTPWDISTMSFNSFYDLSAIYVPGGGIPPTAPLNLSFSSIGNRFYSFDSINNSFYQRDLAGAWAFSTSDSAVNVTINDTILQLTSANHGLSDGDIIKLTLDDGNPTLLNETVKVERATTNTFDVAVPYSILSDSTSGSWTFESGSIIDITSNGITPHFFIKENEIALIQDYAGDGEKSANGLITGTTTGATITVTSPNHGLVNGETIIIESLDTTPAIAFEELVISNVTDSTFDVTPASTITIAGTTGNWFINDIFLPAIPTDAEPNGPVLSQQIDQAAISLVKIINLNPNGIVNGYYFSEGESLPGQFFLEQRDLVGPQFYMYASNSILATKLSPSIGVIGVDENKTVSSNLVRQNRIYYSKYQQPEAVPVINYIDIGPRDDEIQRIIALRDSLFIFKTEGIYRLSGDVAPFQVAPFDFSLTLQAPDTAVVLNNQIHCFTTQGVAQVTDTGVNVISRDIEDKLLEITRPGFATKTASFGVSYETERSYLLFTVTTQNDINATQCYRYNSFTNTWTRWEMDRTCGVVNRRDNKLYLGSADINNLEQERKNLDRTDYADRQYNKLINAVSSNQLELDSLTFVNIGDLLLQTQYLTIEQFNNLLTKLDLDTGVNDTDYLSTLVALAGDNMRTKVDSLATKLDLDTGVNDTDYVSSLIGGSSFSEIQSDFNIIINKLNSDTGVNDTDYELSSGTTDFEAIILSNLNETLPNTVEVNDTLLWIDGPVVHYTSIPTTVIYSPQVFGDPSSYKQVSEGTYIFEDNNLTLATIGYKSDLSPTFDNILVDNTLADVNSAKPIRTYIPLQKQRCRFLQPQLIHQVAFEKWSLYGVTLSFRPYSTRAYK